jgi:hypothetical protein
MRKRIGGREERAQERGMGVNTIHICTYKHVTIKPLILYNEYTLGKCFKKGKK